MSTDYCEDPRLRPLAAFQSRLLTFSLFTHQNHTTLICILWEILDVTDKTCPHCVMRLRMQGLSCLVQL